MVLNGLYIPLEFKRGRCQGELLRADPRLVGAFLGLALSFYASFQKPLYITCVNRTPRENRDAGGQEDSGHLYGRAIDIRTRQVGEYPGLTDDEKIWLDKFWEKHYDHGRYWSLIDEGDHIHIQVPGR